MSDFPKGPRSKRGKNTNDQNPQSFSIFSTDTRDIVPEDSQEEPIFPAVSKDHYKKLALLETLIREKECEIKRMAHDHQLAISQYTAQAEYYKSQYNLMMEEMQNENRTYREANHQLTANYEDALENVQKLSCRLQKEKGEYNSKEKKCEDLLIKTQNDCILSKKEFGKLQERAQQIDRELQEARAKETHLDKELGNKARALSVKDSQMQRMEIDNQGLEVKLVDSLKDIETYKGILLALENDFHNSFPRIARPHSTSQSFRFEWLVTAIRDCTQQLLADHHQLKSNVIHIEKERDLLKNEQLSIYNALMRQIAIAQLDNQLGEDSSNSKLLHLLSSYFKDSLQNSEMAMLEKTQENEFLSKEVANLQTYITSLKQDKEELQLSNTRLEQINKKSLNRIDTIQKENNHFTKPDYSNSPHDVTSYAMPSCFSPSRQRGPNTVMEKAKQEISNLERDKMFLLSQVESLSHSLKNNNFFQSTPRKLNSYT